MTTAYKFYCSYFQTRPWSDKSLPSLFQIRSQIYEITIFMETFFPMGRLVLVGGCPKKIITNFVRYETGRFYA